MNPELAALIVEGNDLMESMQAEIDELVALVRLMRLHTLAGATNGLWAEYARVMARYPEAE